MFLKSLQNERKGTFMPSIQLKIPLTFTFKKVKSLFFRLSTMRLLIMPLLIEFFSVQLRAQTSSSFSLFDAKGMVVSTQTQLSVVGMAIPFC